MPCLSTMACRFFGVVAFLCLAHCRADNACPLDELVPQTFTVERKIASFDNSMAVRDDSYHAYMISHLFKSIWIFSTNTDLYTSDGTLWATLAGDPGTEQMLVKDCNGNTIAKFKDDKVYDKDMAAFAAIKRHESSTESILSFDSLDTPPAPLARITAPKLIPVPFLCNLLGLGLSWTTEMKAATYTSMQEAQTNEQVTDEESTEIEDELSSAANIVTDPRVILLAGAWAFGGWKVSPLTSWIFSGLFWCCACCGCCLILTADDKKEKTAEAKPAKVHPEHEALIEDPHKTKHITSEASHEAAPASSGGLFSCCSRRTPQFKKESAAPAPAHGHGGGGGHGHGGGHH